MSLEAMVWVLSGDAPVADVNEYAVLGAMADKADPDGCGSWLSKETIAARVHVSEETVKRCWRNMARRGVIAKGDQSLVSHYRADRRPVVYDLLIPYGWFSNIDRVNAERERLGRPPLTPQDRPPIAPAPVKPARADKGKPRPAARGNSQTPRKSAAGTPDGGTTSRRRGNYKSSTGELEDPQNSKNNQSHTSLSDPDVTPDPTASAEAPTARESSAAREDDQALGGVPQQREAELDEDQERAEAFARALPGSLGRASVARLVPGVVEALAEGWTPEALRAFLVRKVDVGRVAEGAVPTLYFRWLHDRPAPPAAARPAAEPDRCERHPAFKAGDCPPCIRAARAEDTGPAPVDGAGLLARLRAAQSA
ncbi:hypothetical protein [Streptomyces griseoaurantiacus]|uniref:hypothetical protein n=1 Tax=Streptomyces griseoaurantiacus TaxID=68213 RepID=UPI002E282CA0|nr:hypothetical protein [Streptomyces jietaisiensis]